MGEQRTRARASWKGGAKEGRIRLSQIAEDVKDRAGFYFDRMLKDGCIEAIVTKIGPVAD